MKTVVEGTLTNAEAAWALVGDTDHLHRLAGDPPVEMDIVADEHGYPEVRGTILGPGPIRHKFIETHLSWVRERSFRNVRELEGPLLSRAIYEACLTPEAGGVKPSILIDMEAAHPWGRPLVSMFVKRLARTWEAALRELPAPADPDTTPSRSLPRDVLASLDRWRAATPQASIVERTRTWLTRAHARELRELRPYALADAWGLGRRDVLQAFLDATTVGALELYWSVRCPRCHAGVGHAESLSNLADHAECPSCRIDFGPDLDRTVEVLFAAHPAIRPERGEQFCTLFPAGRPDVLCMQTVLPGEEATMELELPPGRWFLGPGGDLPDAEIEAEEGGPDAMRWEPNENSDPVRLGVGPVRIAIHNPTRGRLRVQLAGKRLEAPAVSAAYLATMPEYRRQFGSQVLAPDIRVGVQAMGFLFTDLVGSAAMYSEVGDAAAFGVVHEHFGLLEEVVERYGGVRVKTIGDALMCAFHRPGAAATAALAMLQHFNDWASNLPLERPPGIRIGLHYGPAIAVHSDTAGLDYFGGSVNLAARVEGLAREGEVVWTAAVHADSEVEEHLDREGWTVEPFGAEVKGIPGLLQLYRITLPAPGQSVSPA